MKSFKKASMMVIPLMLIGLAVDVDAAVNNANNDYFNNMYQMVLRWSQGYLARAVSIAAFLIGAIMGFARGTAMPALVGFGFAVVFSIGPTVINGILGATI